MMKKLLIFIAIVIGFNCVADTPPIIYQFASPLVKTNGKDVSIPPATSGANGYLTSANWSLFNAKEPPITAGTSLQYWRGDKTFVTLNTSVVPELTNLYWTQGRFDSALALKTSSDISEGSNLYFTVERAQDAIGGGLSAPLTYNDGGNLIGITQASSVSDGYLSLLDWNTFAGKQASGNYITALTGDVTASGPGSVAATIPAGTVTDAKSAIATKPPSTVVAVTNQTKSGTPTIDGIATAAGSIILLTAQTTGSENGPWVAAAGAWSRPTWYPNGGTTQAVQYSTTLIRLGSTYSGSTWRMTTPAPITIGTTSTTWVITKITLNSLTSTKADATHDGFISVADWNTFNSKLDSSSSNNYATNGSFEVDAANWNLYNDTGRTAPATVTVQDITYTSALSGNAGNGATVSYTLCGVSYVGPIVTCPTGTSVQICWYNGPTLNQNPAASLVKSTFDATACAVAIASSAITGTASNRQYETGTATLGGGGDTAPVDGTGGSPSGGLVFSRTVVTPLVGTASGNLAKDAVSRQGEGVSTDFQISSADKGNPLQVSFYYQGDSGFAFGSSSDAKVFVYDITNAVMDTCTPRQTLTGPTALSTYRFVCKFTASQTSVNYRLIIHTATTHATAWNLLLDSVTINNSIDATAATQVPSLVLSQQAISGAVTDHMAVMWKDGASSWVPLTQNGDLDTLERVGFATNLNGLFADITLSGSLSGFSFGPFVGYEQYVDTTAGGITPLPLTFTDNYWAMGKAIASDTLLVQPKFFSRLVTSKGGLLTNSGVNTGAGDVVVAAGTTGQFLRYNTGLANGFSAFTPVGTAPIVYTAATSAWSCVVATGSVAGCLAAADFTIFAAKASTASPTFTGTPTLPTGTIGVTQTAGNSTTALATTAFVTTADNLKANLASPTLTGTPTLPTGTIGVTQTAGNSTTALATTAFVTTADNLKANIAAPTLTGDVTLSTGNLLITTIGKGTQIKTGTNAKIGTATLVGGTATVANTSVTANSRIFLTSNTDGGTPGWLRVSAKTNGTSFVITSSSGTDTSTVAWEMIESIP